MGPARGFWIAQFKNAAGKGAQAFEDGWHFADVAAQAWTARFAIVLAVIVIDAVALVVAIFFLVTLPFLSFVVAIFFLVFDRFVPLTVRPVCPSVMLSV